MKLLSLKQLETLREIASSGSLVAAAGNLHMTPAALTARVKALEETLGLSLFERTPAGLKPNMAGIAALESARKIEIALKEVTETMENIRSGQGGRLSVGVVSTAKYFAPRVIAAFKQVHPRVELRLSIGNRDETMAALKGFDIDVALTGRPPGDLPIDRTTIGPHPYVLVAPPFHRLAGKRGIRKAELAGEGFLFREEGSGSRSLFEYFIGDVPVDRRSLGIELGSNETIKQAVMAGLGISLISAHTIAAEVADGRLICLDVVGLPIVRQWYVIHRSDRELSPVARAFRDFVGDRCAHFLPRLARQFG
jgi:DNA-binding transcriptional LysR family regulator